MNNHLSPGLRHQEQVWNDRARENAQFYIVSEPAMRDPIARDAAFELSGQNALAELVPWLFPEATVLDLGCGIGRVMRPVAPYVRRVIGVDIAQAMLDRARDYLVGASNIELHKTTGDSLAGVADDSVDFLYSLLCFLQLDKRIAWKYLLEIVRVLRPGAVARLQFNNILAPGAMGKFVESMRSDLPQIYYAPQEVELLLAHAGLGQLQLQLHGGFIEAYVVKGDPEAWRRELHQSVTFETQYSRPVALGAAMELHRPLIWLNKWQNTGAAWHGFRFGVRVIEPAHPADYSKDFLRGSAVIRLPALSRGDFKVTLHHGAPHMTLTAVSGAALITHTESVGRSPVEASDGELLFACIPAGCDWNPAEAARWPGAAWQRLIQVVPRV